MTHSELVQRAKQWLSGSQRCGVVITERLGMAMLGERGSEMPDAIGWGNHTSILVECKTSVSDMVADKRKRFRRHGGAGDVRYILCEKGVIGPTHILPGWGLLWVCGKVVRMIVRSRCVNACAVGLRRERYLLTAELMDYRMLYENANGKLKTYEAMSGKVNQ